MPTGGKTQIFSRVLLDDGAGSKRTNSHMLDTFAYAGVGRLENTCVCRESVHVLFSQLANFSQLFMPWNTWYDWMPW